MDPVFDDFIQSLKLTSKQRDDAITKHTGVCKTLHNHYYPSLEYTGRTKLLIGSYGKRTNIRPPGDVDVIFRMPDATYDEYTSKKDGQSSLLQDVRAVLSKTYTTTEKISAFGKVVVIQFSEGAHSVEVLPAWEQSDGSYIIPNTSNGGSWERWNPIADIESINNSDKETQKTKSVIRLLKKWVSVCNVTLKPFMLELLVVNHLQQYYGNKVADVTYTDILATFLGHLLTLPETYISIPSGNHVSLGSDWVTKTQSAQVRLNKASDAYDNKDLEAATSELRKIFGDTFPKVEVQKEYLSDTRLAELFQQYPSDEDEFIEDRFPVKINPEFTVLIDTRIKGVDGFRDGFLLEKLIGSMFFMLPKKASLSFYIKGIDIPQPFEVYWKVRNFGEEAQQKDYLRGKITKDEGKHEKVEGTQYTGIHFVECYIIKNGNCVAIGRIPVPIGT